MEDVNKLIERILSDNRASLLVNGCGIHAYPANYKFGPHGHNSVEVNFVKKGCCNMKIGNDYVHYRENDCMIIYPGIPHYFFVDKNRGCTLVQLDFNVESFSELSVQPEVQQYMIFLYDLATNSRQYMKVYDRRSIVSCMERILEELERKPDNFETLLNLYFCELFIVLSRQIKSTLESLTAVSNEYVKKALEYINDHFHDEVNIACVAEKCGISTRYLLELFKRQTKMSPMEYITRLRIRKAKELMADRSLNITEVALNAGYSNLQYFCKMFKSQVGMTAKEYRRELFRKV